MESTSSEVESCGVDGGVEWSERGAIGWSEVWSCGWRNAGTRGEEGEEWWWPTTGGRIRGGRRGRERA
jgi:hypothetical protein